MSLCAVLGCVATTGDAKERAHRMGAVDVLLEAVRAHFNHDGLRTWACGCLSNINQHAHAAARFVQMDGIERMLDIIKVVANVFMRVRSSANLLIHMWQSTAALEESVGAAAELTNELIGSAARAIRSVIMQAMYMERAIRVRVICWRAPLCPCVLHLLRHCCVNPGMFSQAGIVKLSIAVLIVRGHKTPVREAMLGFIKDVCTFSEYRPLLLEPSLNAMYTILTTTVKMCVKKGLSSSIVH